jgi:predicted TIM-barrel fold metal-dependent hydrolase
VFGLWPRRDLDVSLETLLRIKQRAGISAVCSLSTRGIFHNSILGNAETLAVSQEHTDIIPVATLDLREITDYAADLKKLKAQGFKLLRFFREYQGWPLDYQPFDDLVRALEQVTFPLYVTVTALGEITWLGRRLRACAFPVVVGGVNASFAPLFAEAISVATRCRAIYFDTHRFDSVDAYEVFADKLGAKRLVFGSGAPLCYAESALNALRKSALSERDKQLVLHKNLDLLLHRRRTHAHH